MTQDRSTRLRIAIVGGGPAGLIAAIELGRRGIPVTLFEEDPEPLKVPKANATTARTMEHFRRLGFSRDVRALGLPKDYRQDIAYFTRYAEFELARLPGPSRQEAEASRASATSRWPTPEPLHRAQQMFIEPVLVAQARRYPAIDLRLGWRIVKVAPSASTTCLEAVCVADGRTETFEAVYLIGCEGPRSLTRNAIGVGYAGLREEDRDFMGGRMLTIFFEAPDFFNMVPHPPAWQYWAINPTRRGVAVAIDGKQQFVLLAQLARGQAASQEFASECIVRTMGRELPHRLLATGEWTAGLMLVAERFQHPSDQPRIFLLGDAAHLFTPTGGQGYNTAVDDAVNLGWKLAATCAGWGGPHILASYERERKPIAERNTQFARAMADSIGRLPVPAHIEDKTPAGREARAELGRVLRHHAEREFDVPGIHFGTFYANSPIIEADGASLPVDAWDSYVPHTTPGARAPHVWIADDVSIFDCLGRDFTLLRLGSGTAGDATAFNAAAAALGLPLDVVDIAATEARDIYGFDHVLVRPDHHIAWRGNALPGNPRPLLERVMGHQPTGRG